MRSNAVAIDNGDARRAELRLLIQQGADIDTPNEEGLTLLEALLDQKQRIRNDTRNIMIELLVEHGANPLKHPDLLADMISFSNRPAGYTAVRAMRTAEARGEGSRMADGGNALHCLLSQTSVWNELLKQTTTLGMGRNGNLSLYWLRQADGAGRTVAHVLMDTEIEGKAVEAQRWLIAQQLLMVAGEELFLQPDQKGVRAMDLAVKRWMGNLDHNQKGLGLEGDCRRMIEKWVSCVEQERLERETRVVAQSKRNPVRL